MLSKFLNVAARCQPVILKQKLVPLVNTKRASSHLIPPNQYDMPWPKRLKLLYVTVNYWEVIPLFTCTAFALVILFYSIFNACCKKCDVVFTTHNRQNISRTMDLRNPRVLKIIVINQRYSPWPEMQDVLDKMYKADQKALLRAQSCGASAT